MIAAPLGQPSPQPTARQLLWRAVALGFYLAIAWLLITATVAYTGAWIIVDPHSTISVFITLGLVALIWVFVVALYFAEGCEIAATTVLERDEGELDLGNTSRVLVELHDHTDDFVSGRQFIVVVLVIIFAAFCEAYAREAPHPTKTAGYHYVAWLFENQIVLKIYAIMFPILTALWLSQLFSKFVAKRRPATFFRSPVAQLLVRWSITLGKRLRVGDVSMLLSKRALRGKHDDARTASRIKLYSALATFKDGFGFEKVLVHIDIDPNDGSCDVRQHIFVHSYASRGKLVRQDDDWSGEIINPMLVVNPQRDVAVMGPTLTPDKKNVKWDFALANGLRIGEEFDFIVSYNVGPGGVTHGEHAVDWFSYLQQKYPVRRLSVSVRLKDKSTFMLTGGSILAEVSDDPDINAREAMRFADCIVGNDGGYDYDIEYPLMGGVYKVQWKIERQLSHSVLAGIAPPIAPLAAPVAAPVVPPPSAI